MNLKEEDNNNYLNCKVIMEVSTCSKFGLHLVKSDKMEQSKEFVTVLSSKCTVLACNEFLAYRLSVYYFCICYDCKIAMFLNADKKLEG